MPAAAELYLGIEKQLVVFTKECVLHEIVPFFNKDYNTVNAVLN